MMEKGNVERIYAPDVILKTRRGTREMENDVCTLIESGREGNREKTRER
jgi:hypothetical protein